MNTDNQRGPHGPAAQTRVAMVRIEAESNRLYDREAVMGRDTTSVFPTESKKLQNDMVNAAIGGLKFVTEDELKQLKGASAGEDDTNINQSDKPLSEVLRAAAERKEEEFQEKWRIMKEGGNRPLDEEEVAFLDEMEMEEHRRQQDLKREEEEEVLAYRLQLAERSTVRIREAVQQSSFDYATLNKKAEPGNLIVAECESDSAPTGPGIRDSNGNQKNDTKPKQSLVVRRVKRKTADSAQVPRAGQGKYNNNDNDNDNDNDRELTLDCKHRKTEEPEALPPATALSLIAEYDDPSDDGEDVQI